MTYRAARDKLIELVEAAAPTITGQHGLPRFFEHDVRASEVLPPGPRQFYMRYNAGAGAGSEAAGFYTVGRRTRLKTIDLVIGYQRISDAALLDAAMGEDMDTIADALLAEENWDVATTGIVAITQGASTALPHTIEQAEENVILCRLQFGLEHY